jgi:putative MATE family efflux protein
VEAVAAVSLSFPILFFLTALAMGFATGGGILVAQYNGRGDKRSVARTTGQTFSLVTILAVILSAIGYFSSHALLSLLTNDPLVLGPATDYLQILFLAMPALFISVIFQSTLRGIGEVTFPMIVVLISVVINFFIDPLFMFGWKFIPAMGVSGVAFATLITEGLSGLIAIIVLAVRIFDIDIHARDLLPQKAWFKKIFILGLPSSLEMSSRSFGMVLMTFIVSTLGTFVIAVYGIGTKILSFVIIPAIGFSIATSIMVGNSLGAKRIIRAQHVVRAGIKIGFWILLAFGGLLFVFARHISAFFVPGEPAIIVESATFIRMMALTFGFIGIQMVIIGALKAAGKTTTSMFLALFNTFVLFVLSFLLSKIFALDELGIWIAYPAANTLSLGLAWYFYKKKDWLQKELV